MNTPDQLWRRPEDDYGCFPAGHGLWAAALWVYVPAAPVSKANHRVSTTSSRSAPWAKVRAFEAEVALLLRRARPAGWDASGSGPVRARPATVVAVFASTTLDAGNVSKSVLDAAQGVLYPSDAQVPACAEVVQRSLSDRWMVVAAAQPAKGVAAHEALTALVGAAAGLVVPGNT